MLYFRPFRPFPGARSSRGLEKGPTRPNAIYAGVRIGMFINYSPHSEATPRRIESRVHVGTRRSRDAA